MSQRRLTDWFLKVVAAALGVVALVVLPLYAVFMVVWLHAAPTSVLALVLPAMAAVGLGAYGAWRASGGAHSGIGQVGSPALDGSHPVNTVPVSVPAFSFPEGVFLVFTILVVADALSISIGAFNSSDVRGWWVVILWFSVLFDFAYALVFMFLARRSHMRLRAVITCITALAVLLVLRTALSHALGGASAAGSAGLIGRHSSAINSALYAMFLLGLACRGRPAALVEAED